MELVGPVQVDTVPVGSVISDVTRCPGPVRDLTRQHIRPEGRAEWTSAHLPAWVGVRLVGGVGGERASEAEGEKGEKGGSKESRNRDEGRRVACGQVPPSLQLSLLSSLDSNN
jgi:hypothetical protein